MNKKLQSVDPLAEVKKSKNFQKYSKEARERIRLAVEIYNTRETLRISQQELAKKAQTTQKVISRIESADVNIGFALLCRIASVLSFNYENWGNVLNFDTPCQIIFMGKETGDQASEAINFSINNL